MYSSPSSVFQGARGASCVALPVALTFLLNAVAAASAPQHLRGPFPAASGEASPLVPHARPLRRAAGGARLPSNGRVAIILRGEAFRAGGHRSRACQEDRIEQQVNATQSLLDRVVLPLEEHSNIVRVYAYEGSKCTSLLPYIFRLLGARLVSHASFKTGTQANSVKKALEMFSLVVKDPAAYDLIIVARFDTIWKLPINAWPTVDFGAFNFFSRCEKSPVNCRGLPCSSPELCVHDVIQAMPGSYFLRFREIVGTGVCFKPFVSGGNGHRCYNQTAEAFGAEHIAFVTDWIPEADVREANDVIEMGYHGHGTSQWRAIGGARVPSFGRVAIILRGDALNRAEQQIKATQSFLDRVVLPLEEHFNIVHIYAHEGPKCTASRPHIFGLLGGRLMSRGCAKTLSEAKSFKKALKMFSSSVEDPEDYDLIIVARFDTVWKLPIDAWPTVDFGAFNFFSRCEKSPLHCSGRSCSSPELCVHDVIQAMPASYFLRFRHIVGTGICFKPFKMGGNGHYCYNQTAEAFGVEHIAFITDWIPEADVHEANDLIEAVYDDHDA